MESRIPAPERSPAAAEEMPQMSSPAAEARESSGELGRLRQEMAAMRSLLEHQVSRLAWDQRSRRNPHEAHMIRELSSLGLAPEVIEEMLPVLVCNSARENVWSVALDELARRIPVVSEDLVDSGGIYAFVGPTGVGKTTTVAKLAARFALRHGRESVALVTTDNYRIAAREQLETFARILGASVYQVSGTDSLATILAGLDSHRLVLLDTAGMSQRDMRITQQLSWLRQKEHSIRVILTMAANAQPEVLEEVVGSFADAEPAACVLTKIDEAGSLGGALSVLMGNDLPLAYVANGQRVPEDVFLASGNQNRLINVCAALARRTGSVLTENTMAEKFGEVASNAHA